MLRKAPPEPRVAATNLEEVSCLTRMMAGVLTRPKFPSQRLQNHSTHRGREPLEVVLQQSLPWKPKLSP